jgi:hypothetical protein
MTENLDMNQGTPARPTFLTVLCILTYVGAGIGILSGIWGLFTLQSTIATLEASQGLLEGLGGELGGELSSQVEALKNYGMIAQLLGVVGNILCLLGAFWMWSLKKTGFYTYVVGQVLPLVATFGLLGGMGLGGMFGGFAILGAIFPIAFIVMYALNLKHMN